MIAVVRGHLPSHLVAKDVDLWTQELCDKRAQYYRDLNAFTKRKISKMPERPDAKGNHYGHESVREALSLMFGLKCAYCEAEVAPTSFQHVDHYRPASRYPALAYAWDNLLLACERCNSKYKKHYFPLSPSGKTRAELKGSPGNLKGSREKPFLLNPCRDQPEDHLTFKDGLVVAKTERGEHTRDVCGLNRDHLVTSRKRYLQIIQRSAIEYLIAITEGDVARQQRHRDDLILFVAPSSPYSAMAKAEIELNGIDWRTL